MEKKSVQIFNLRQDIYYYNYDREILMNHYENETLAIVTTQPNAKIIWSGLIMALVPVFIIPGRIYSSR